MTEHAEVPRPTRSGKVLVVDDDPKNRELLRNLLEAKGHSVTEAESGQKALGTVKATRPDVVLLDVMMPGMDGFEVCRRLKGNPDTAPIPVLMVTALEERSDRITGIDAGANDFLTKPVDPQDVVLRVRNAVAAKKLYDQLQESYDRLKELEVLRDNLTHMIVHDLRSPLTGIMGFMQLVQMQAGQKLDDTESQFLGKALASCSTLLEMINSLLDVNRLEEGKMPLKPARCDLRALADEAIETLGAATEGIKLRFDRPTEEVIAHCDPEVVRRIIANLLGNAIRFTPKEGEVRLALESDPERARVSVTDSGPGIPPDYREKIFDKFGQVEAREDNRKYSTGLGLTFCKLAVEAHGGRIGLVSEVGRGSTFWFELPAANVAGS